jgi:hypothetical protein
MPWKTKDSNSAGRAHRNRSPRTWRRTQQESSLAPFFEDSGRFGGESGFGAGRVVDVTGAGLWLAIIAI